MILAICGASTIDEAARSSVTSIAASDWSITISNDGFGVSSARVLFEDPAIVSQYDVTPDGTQFVMFRQSAETGADDSVELRVVQNWLEELNRLVPIE